jgi:hypothetical protein
MAATTSLVHPADMVECLSSFTPEVDEEFDGAQRINWEPNEVRKSLFESFTFLFLEQEQVTPSSVVGLKPIRAVDG